MKRNEKAGSQAFEGLFRQTALLIGLKLRNCLGINEVIHGKDGRKSIRLTGMLLVYMLLAGLMIFYLAAAAVLLCMIGAGESVPAFAALISGAVIFIFSFLKAAPILFDAADLERLSPLPLSPVSVIISRFFILYAEELLFSAAIVLPASLVYLMLERPGIGSPFYDPARASLSAASASDDGGCSGDDHPCGRSGHEAQGSGEDDPYDWLLSACGGGIFCVFLRDKGA